MNGKVYLVGAGPGDPDLLTVKALNILRRADAVLHDDLVLPQILDKASQSALRYDVGKRCGRASTRQEAIHFLMIELARQGMQVVRLKGGDPTIFGRAGEEIRALRQAGIEFEIVPGVTSAMAAAAAAEISLTMRNAASSLLILTGHSADHGVEGASGGKMDRAHGGTGAFPDLRALLAAGTTIALYMPGSDPRATVEKLAAAGVPRNTSCALVSQASTATEQITAMTLAALAQLGAYPKPAILIVGDVARLSRQDRVCLASIAEQATGQHAEVPQQSLAGARIDSHPYAGVNRE